MNLKELSEHLNLSQTTVSRALNGYPEVNEDTRARVIAAAAEFNYRPSAAATSLASGLSGNIGYVLPTDRSIMIDPHFSEFLAGAAEFCATCGFDMLIAPTHATGIEATYERMQGGGHVDGIILPGPQRDDQQVERALKGRVPFVVHGRTERPVGAYEYLDIDNRGAFRQACSLLTDLGHTRIALIDAPTSLTFAWHRLQGYADALSARGLQQDNALVIAEPMTEDAGYRAMRQFLELEDPPTAVLCASMLSALGAIRASLEKELEIGRDVSIIAHDDVLPYIKAENMTPPLTTTRSSIREAGHRVAEILIARIRDPGTALVNEIWPVDLIVRASTGPAPK